MRLPIFLVIFASLFTGAAADGLIVIRNPPERIPGHFAFAPLEVVFHKVEVEIAGQRATTRVAQEFFNPNGATLEGEYLFPIPVGAHLDKFTMRIGDKDAEAELLDAAKAKSIYEEIVRKQKDPALLEYTGRPAFRVRIYPIEGRSTKKVTLEYTELLKADGGLASYIYPLNTEKFSSKPLQKVEVRVKLSADSPLKALYSPSHPVEVVRDGERRASVEWKDADVSPNTDFQLLFSTGETAVGLSLLTHKVADEDGWFLLLASPGAEMTKSEAANPKDVVFVLDTSGSMAGKKLDQAKKALTFCVENLNEADRFEIVRFSTDAEPLFEKLTDASANNRGRALKFIDKLKPTGSTAIATALDTAMALKPADSKRPFLVVFLTDGLPTIGERNEDQIVARVARVARENPTTTRVFCFGIGTDVNAHLLDKIAERTAAASQFILPEEDLESKVTSFFTKIAEPLLTDLKLDFPSGIRVTKLLPNPLPDLFRGGQLVLTGRYDGTAEGELTLHGKVNGEPRQMSQKVRFSREEGQEFIAQLWATRRVGFLLDEIRLRGENSEVRDEVVDLARRFGIVTPYTSYLIVEDETRRQVPVAARTLQKLGSDSEAQSYLRRNWEQMTVTKDGYNGSLAGRANDALKSASTPSEAVEKAKQQNLAGVISNNAKGEGGAGAGAVAAAPKPSIYAQPGAMRGRVGTEAGKEVADRTLSAEQNTRFINGKTFTQNGAQWNDTTLHAAQEAKRTRIQFGSPEYFALLAEKPLTSQWLALGNNVTFTLGKEIYEVYE